MLRISRWRVRLAAAISLLSWSAWGASPAAKPTRIVMPSFTKDVFAAESNPYYAAFVEDTFHPSKALTITAGLRWDIFGGRNERYNRQEYFDPNASNTFDGVSYTGAEIYANGGNRSPFTANLHDFGPRLAFAWQPVTHLVLRGGAGFYYGPSTHNVGSALLNTDGFASQTFWSRDLLQRGRQYRLQRHLGMSRCAGRKSATHSRRIYGPLFTEQPIPQRSCPNFHHPAPRTGK